MIIIDLSTAYNGPDPFKMSEADRVLSFIFLYKICDQALTHHIKITSDCILEGALRSVIAGDEDREANRGLLH